ncbi:hypothetical protein [Nocardioides pakistanensis]
MNRHALPLKSINTVVSRLDTDILLIEGNNVAGDGFRIDLTCPDAFAKLADRVRIDLTCPDAAVSWLLWPAIAKGYGVEGLTHLNLVTLDWFDLPFDATRYLTDRFFRQRGARCSEGVSVPRGLPSHCRHARRE